MKNIFRWMRNLIIRLVLWFVNHEGGFYQHGQVINHAEGLGPDEFRNWG